MNAKQHIDALFSGYEETAALSDFKEELQSNLNDRVKSLMKKGLNEETAFEKAISELGDVSALAEELSLKKKQEVFEAMYMKTRIYMDKWHIIGYTVAGGLLALGIILTLVAYFATHELKVGIASLIPFFIAPVCGFVFLCLTQETAKKFAMSWKRALIYVATVAVILFGLVVFTFLFFEGADSVAIIGTLIPFALPGAIALVFLLLTEKSRQKPWVIEQEAVWANRMKAQFADPYAATRFGLFSGALWIGAISVFIVLTFSIGILYSWLALVVAVIGQMLITAASTKKNG